MYEGEGSFGPSPSRSQIVEASGFSAFARIAETPNNIFYEAIP